MDPTTFILISIATGFATHYAWKQGITEGVARSLQVLHENKIIAYDNKGEIYPNPFFEKK